MGFLCSPLQICVHIAISERLQTAEKNKIFQPGHSEPKACLFFPILIFYSYTYIFFSYSLYLYIFLFLGKSSLIIQSVDGNDWKKMLPQLELGCAHLLVSTLRTCDHLEISSACSAHWLQYRGIAGHSEGVWAGTERTSEHWRQRSTPASWATVCPLLGMLEV